MKHTKSLSLKAIIAGLAIVACFNTKAQDWKSDQRVNVLFGLNQVLLLSGFNMEVNYIYKRFIFDYSHGVSLVFKGSTSTSSFKKQGVEVHMPWTTGFGVGYRLTEWLNIRVEPKWHRFEFYYENGPKNKSDKITSYNTNSLGLGLYSSFRPFKKQDNFLNGIMISPSIRFWPTVYSTLKDGKFTYFNKNTLANEEIKTLDPGLGFTPLVINVSVGYSFNIKKKR